MSLPPHPDPCAERRAWQENPTSIPPHKTTATPVERPFTASQAHTHQQVTQEPLNNILEDQLEDDKPGEQGATTPIALDTTHHPLSPSPNISNLELWTTLLNLGRQPALRTQKRDCGIKEPDTFSGGNSDNLQAFVF